MPYKFNPFTGTFDDVTSGGGGGGTTNPGGSTTQVQFNDGGAFGGDVDLTWNKTTNVLGIAGDVNLSDGGTYTTTLQTITPTAARTISLPDATGTVALVAGSSGQVLWNNAGVNAGASTLTYDGSILTTSGRFINSYNATASSPAKAFTGTWFTGGTGTTTKPQVLIEPTGTTSTGWSTSGTGLGVNAASGFSGNLLDLQVNGTSIVRASTTGFLNFANLVGGFNGFRFQQAGVDRFTCAQNSDGELLFSRFNTGGTFQANGLYLGNSGLNGINLTNAPTAALDVNGDTIRLRTAKTPASATAAGNAGDHCWDANYLYVCTATNTWKRAALTTW